MWECITETAKLFAGFGVEWLLIFILIIFCGGIVYFLLKNLLTEAKKQTEQLILLNTNNTEIKENIHDIKETQCKHGLQLNEINIRTQICSKATN